MKKSLPTNEQIINRILDIQRLTLTLDEAEEYKAEIQTEILAIGKAIDNLNSEEIEQDYFREPEEVLGDVNLLITVCNSLIAFIGNLDDKHSLLIYQALSKEPEVDEEVSTEPIKAGKVKPTKKRGMTEAGKKIAIDSVTSFYGSSKGLLEGYMRLLNNKAFQLRTVVRVRN